MVDQQAALDQVRAAIFIKPPTTLSTADRKLLSTARAASNGIEFALLYDKGDVSRHGGDDSAADLALGNLLAFYAGSDPARIDRLFRGSALMRAKWDEKRGAKLYSEITITKALDGRTEFYSSDKPGNEDVPTISVVSAAAFASVDEPGAEPIVGEGDDVVIGMNSDSMFYGDGGSGKTTLSIDLACHLAAGEDWLGFEVRRSRVLMIEREGPRPLLRRKIARKIKFWTGVKIDDRFLLLDEPWAKFTFASEQWRAGVADVIREREVDLLLVGPLTRVGMDEAGTLQQVNAFMELVNDLRLRSGRPLAVVIVHHENKGGTVSGAWEGAGDTLMHVEERSHGSTGVTFQKARWASNVHGTAIELAWIAGEGFRIKDERDLLSQITAHLAAHPWMTVKEIAAPAEKSGIGASDKIVGKTLKEHQGTFVSHSGDQHGRHKNATLWSLRQTPNADDADNVQTGPEEGVCVTASPVRGRSVRDADPLSASAPSTQTDLEDLI